MSRDAREPGVRVAVGRPGRCGMAELLTDLRRFRLPPSGSRTARKRRPQAPEAAAPRSGALDVGEVGAAIRWAKTAKTDKRDDGGAHGEAASQVLSSLCVGGGAQFLGTGSPAAASMKVKGSPFAGQTGS
jgi:hypothetical protein